VITDVQGRIAFVHVGRDRLRRFVPVVRWLEDEGWELPGWRFTAARVEAGRVTLELERE
jgi:hypothetical protein